MEPKRERDLGDPGPSVVCTARRESMDVAEKQFMNHKPLLFHCMVSSPSLLGPAIRLALAPAPTAHCP